jgi:flagellum-specific peptidoglycan hydrolase FlgJ
MKRNRRLAYPHSVTVAQAILESGWGLHPMGDVGKIATGYVDQITKEYDKNGRAYTIVAHFRAYKNMTDSFLDHGLFLTSIPRYRKAIETYASSKDADEFARALQRAGYATDPDYADSLISLMTKMIFINSTPNEISGQRLVSLAGTVRSNDRKRK